MIGSADTRPAEGWSKPDSWGHISFVKHDAYPWSKDRTPEAPDGYEYRFIGIHGIGPGNYTRWIYYPANR